MNKYLIIYGNKNNTYYNKCIIWKDSLEEAKAFKPLSEDQCVFQIIYVPKGKQY